MAHILIVDDHPRFRMAARIMLECAGHTVIGETPDGVAGLSLAREQFPDLVSLDLDIPGLGGL